MSIHQHIHDIVSSNLFTAIIMKLTLTVLSTLLAVAMAASSGSNEATEALEKRCYVRGGELYFSSPSVHAV